jgi:predicted ATP-grasp superfamily ATP-dependent carboligase
MVLKEDIPGCPEHVVFVLIQDIPPLAAIHQHRDTRGYSAVLSIRIFHNARCTVILIVSFALIAGAVCFGLSR